MASFFRTANGSDKWIEIFSVRMPHFLGLPKWLSSEESTCQSRRCKFDPPFEGEEEEMATHSSILAWKIPWTEKLGGLQSKGSQRVRWDRGLTKDWAQLGSKMRFTWTGIYKRRFTSSVCQETQDGSLERVTTSLRMLHWPSGSSPLQMLLPVRPYRACWGLWFVWSFAQQPPLWHRQWRLHLPFQEWLPGVSSIYGLGSACNT